MKVQWGDVPTWIVAGIATVGLLGMGTGVGTGYLPTTKAIQEITNSVADEKVEVLLEFVIHYIDNPGSVREGIYRQAFKQAAEKTYVFETPEGYITHSSWRDSNRLLTDFERDQIEKILADSNEPEQIRLMNLVLTDKKLRPELSYDFHIGSKTIHLTPYDKIGVIGGYIGEVKFEH